jgi:hypothetical protein
MNFVKGQDQHTEVSNIPKCQQIIWKVSQENIPLILSNKFNQIGERSAHWKLQNIDERNWRGDK